MAASLLAELRRRIRDVRYASRAMSLAISPSAGCTSAIVEITHGHLMVTTAGGTAPSLDFDLSSTRYNTVQKLFNSISRASGYLVQIDEDCNGDHSSLDLEPFGPLNIINNGVDLKHHLFSDAELDEIVTDAIRRHNPSFTTLTLPSQEHPFVLQLAQANICRLQASDASKRRGCDTDVNTLLSLATSFETSYKDDVARLKRAITSPKEANPNTMGEGDVVLGNMFRRSLRTGFCAPIGLSLPPEAAVLLEPKERDIEDDNVRVNWQRVRDVNFYSFELWMDTRPDVVRIREGLVFTSTPFSFLSNDTSLRAASERRTTSRLVFRSFGANSNFDTVAFATFVEEFGQLIKSFIVGDLEPETDYYFRLYLVSLNYETTSSNIVKIRTKALRCKFDGDNFISVSSGPTGTVADVYFDSDRAAFTTDHQLKVGEKIVIPTIITGYHIQFAFPNFTSKDKYRDLVVISPNNLIDVRQNAVMVTST